MDIEPPPGSLERFKLYDELELLEFQDKFVIKSHLSPNQGFRINRLDGNINVLDDGNLLFWASVSSLSDWLLRECRKCVWTLLLVDQSSVILKEETCFEGDLEFDDYIVQLWIWCLFSELVEVGLVGCHCGKREDCVVRSVICWVYSLSHLWISYSQRLLFLPSQVWLDLSCLFSFSSMYARLHIMKRVFEIDHFVGLISVLSFFFFFFFSLQVTHILEDH